MTTLHPYGAIHPSRYNLRFEDDRFPPLLEMQPSIIRQNTMLKMMSNAKYTIEKVPTLSENGLLFLIFKIPLFKRAK